MDKTEVRKYMEAAAEKLSAARAQEMAKSLMQGQAKGREQVQKVAQDLMDRSNKTRERMLEMIRREVARQLKAMGVASKDDVEALKARVKLLERAESPSGARAAAAKKTSAAKPNAAKASARVAPAKPAPPRRPPGEESGGTPGKAGS
jgi:polyhydroxyalkanoate synthesis regulator phasin